MGSNHNGIFKVNNLLLDIDRPLPIGTHVTYMNAAREVIQATVVQAGYVCLVVWHDNTVSIILYSDLVSIG